MVEKAGGGDLVLDGIVARFDAGTLTLGEAVGLYAETCGIDGVTAGQIVALGLGAEWDEGVEDQLGPISMRGKRARRDEQAAPAADESKVMIEETPFDIAEWGIPEVPPVDEELLARISGKDSPAVDRVVI